MGEQRPLRQCETSVEDHKIDGIITRLIPQVRVDVATQQGMHERNMQTLMQDDRLQFCVGGVLHERAVPEHGLAIGRHRVGAGGLDQRKAEDLSSVAGSLAAQSRTGAYQAPELGIND